MFFDDIKKKIGAFCDTAMIGRVVNKHAHFDNVGGNKKFRDWLGCEILTHENDVESLHNGQILAEYFKTTPKIVTVDTKLKNGDVIKTDNFKFEVISTPGHTPGSICLYDKKSGVLFSGDTALDDFTGRTDLPSSSDEELKKSLLALAEYPAKYLFPGHGQPKINGISFMLKRLAYSRRPTNFV